MSSAAQGVSGLAGRYATALFDLAVEDGALDQVANDIGQLQQMLDESADLKRLIASPIVSRDAQARAMAALAEAAGFAPLTGKFLAVAAANRRLFAVPQFIAAFRVLVARHRGEISAEVTSAGPLSEARIDALRAALGRAVGSDVDLVTRTDPSLLGGLTVRVGSRLVDSSLRTKLQKLQLVMKGAR